MLHGMEGSTMATSSLLHNQDCTLRVQRRLEPDSNHLAAMSQYRLPKRTVDTTHSGNKSSLRAFSCNEFLHYCSRYHDTNTKQIHITTNLYFQTPSAIRTAYGMESTVLSLGWVSKESRPWEATNQDGRDFLSCWLYFTFIKVCGYCTWPETAYNFIFHFGNFEAHPLVRMYMPRGGGRTWRHL